jgi:hypothetical protein
MLLIKLKLEPQTKEQQQTLEQQHLIKETRACVSLLVLFPQ